MKKKINSYEVTYDLVQMNIISIVYTLLVILGIWLLFHYKILVGNFGPFKEVVALYNKGLNSLWFILVLIFWFVLHELIHGLFYIIGGAQAKNISYGIALEKGIFYCKCNKNIKKNNLLLSLMAPFVLIGVITLVISFLLGSYWLLILSLANIMGACGDLTIFFFMIKRDKDLLFREIGDTATFVLTTEEELDKKKYFGIKSIRRLKENEQLEDQVDKMVMVTPKSWPIIIAFVVFFAVFFAVIILLSIII